MPTYILLSSLTPEGSQTLHKDPDRLDAVNKEIADFGCKVVTQYAVLGGYDFVTIVDAPDNETVAHMSVDLSSPSSLANRLLSLLSPSLLLPARSETQAISIRPSTLIAMMNWENSPAPSTAWLSISRRWLRYLKPSPVEISPFRCSHAPAAIPSPMLLSR